MNIKQNNIYKDERGEIQMILENCQVGSISRIISEPKSKRAGHYHLTDGHWIIINEGQVVIFERPTGSKEAPKMTVLNKGDIHWTGPMVDHLMTMPVYTVFDCYSLKSRDSANYEKETVRLDYDLDKEYFSSLFGNIKNKLNRNFL